MAASAASRAWLNSSPAAGWAAGGLRRGATRSGVRSSVGVRRRGEKAEMEALWKRRTRSGHDFDPQTLRRFVSEGNHVPVMLGEVLEVFSRPNLRSFADCTVGAAGHSSAIIQAHPEIQAYVGLDVDHTALEKGQAKINAVLSGMQPSRTSDLKALTFSRNFREIKSCLHQVDEELVENGVDGILMDLGMSSMQVNDAQRGFSVLNDGPLDMRLNPQGILKAEDILNCWPEAEVGRILRDFGEESEWYHLQNKIAKARLKGGLHTTGELVSLIRTASSKSGGRHGWIKTATRVFQALRIAVNDELKTLEDALYVCFDCLSAGGRLAVISFHSLEDRIVKKTFLDIIQKEDDSSENRFFMEMKDNNENWDEEPWIKQRIQGKRGTILTKRPITPSEEEENLNRQSRSAKLRIIQKASHIVHGYSIDENGD